MTKIPSRVLNEKMNFMSLSVIDVSVLGYVLIISHAILSPIGLQLLSFVLVGLVTTSLISIRIKHRPKIIRDFLTYKLTKRI